MNKVLNRERIDYVLFHLFQNCQFDHKLNDCISFGNKEEGLQNPQIVFPLSDTQFSIQKILTIDNIPVLFPVSNNETFFRFEDGNLYFEHDLLKSSFYLLSGYQEYNSSEKDILGRFPYKKSIQEQLGIIEKPVVNYYFEIILNAIEQFCNINQLSFKRTYFFENFGFLLTHDVDKIDKYNFSDAVFKLKQILKLSPTQVPYKRMFRANSKYLLRYFNPIYRKNDFWNFDELIEIEHALGIKSAWYFLENDSPVDSYYQFDESRIQHLISNLEKNGHEVGIHGVVRSAYDVQAMKKGLIALNKYTRNKVVGGRQHRLMFHLPLTHLIHEQVGLKYDSTLGFAAHEGFRNSYCLPFKLYDFESERIIDVWEFPLIVMDGTLFSYRKLNNTEALVQVKKLLSEVLKFHGLFTLLWHNSFFDNDIYPDITIFYNQVLRYIVAQSPNVVLGKDLIKTI